MKQTAVQWIYNKLIKESHATKQDFKKAIQMERQQIIDAWANGEGYNDEEAKEMAKKYYKETYESNNDI